MTKTLTALLLSIGCLLTSTHAGAGVLASDLLLTPLAPHAPRSELRLPAAAPLDPNKPVWVAYKLLAISASDKPKGDIVLDVALEGVKMPMADMFVSFKAERLTHTASAGTIGQQLEAMQGARSEQELSEMFGPELYAAYKALNERRGTMLEGTVVKTYGAIGKDEATLLTSVNRATGMQPMAILVTMGQGEVPAEYVAASQPADGLGRKVWVLLGVLLVGVLALVFRRKR